MKGGLFEGGRNLRSADKSCSKENLPYTYIDILLDDKGRLNKARCCAGLVNVGRKAGMA